MLSSFIFQSIYNKLFFYARIPHLIAFKSASIVALLTLLTTTNSSVVSTSLTSTNPKLDQHFKKTPQEIQNNVAAYLHQAATNDDGKRSKCLQSWFASYFTGSLKSARTDWINDYMPIHSYILYFGKNTQRLFMDTNFSFSERQAETNGSNLQWTIQVYLKN